MNDVQPTSTKLVLLQGAVFLCIYTAIFIAGRVLGIAPGYALDDYVTTLHGSNDLNSHLLSQGRFSFALLNTLINAAGLQQTDFIGIGFMLLLACSALFSWQMFEDVMRRAAWPWVLLTAALLASYPYLTEYVTFRQSLLPMSLMFGLSCLSLRSYVLAFQSRGRQRWHGIGTAIVLGVLAIGMNQIAISLLCVAALFRFMTTHYTENWAAKDLWAALKHTAVFGALLVVGYVLFLLTVKILFNAWDSNERATLLGIADIPNRMIQVAALLDQIFFGSEQLIPLIAKAGVLMAMLLLASVCLMERRFMQLVGALLFVVLGTIFALLPIAVGSVWWPVPRTLITLPLVIVGCLALLLPVRQIRFATVPQTFAAVSVVLFCGLNYSILIDQQRLNRWDMETGRAIAEAVASTFPDSQKPLILNGASWSYPVAPAMALGDMNVSALSIGWAADALIEEAAGKPLDVRVGDPAAATAACANRPRFPVAESVYDSPEGIQICL